MLNPMKLAAIYTAKAPKNLLISIHSNNDHARCDG